MLTPLSDPPPGPAPQLPAAAAEQQTHTKWPPSSLRRRLSVAGQAFTLPSPPSTPGRRGPAGPPRRPPADPGHLYPGPAEFGGPKGTKGSRDEAAGSHFVVSVLGLGLVHPERGTGWVAVGVRRAGSRGHACSLSAGRWAALWGHRGLRAAAGAGERRFCSQAGSFTSRWPGQRVGLSATPRGASEGRPGGLQAFGAGVIPSLQ